MLGFEAELKKEEAEKDLLCSELNILVQQSATMQVCLKVWRKRFECTRVTEGKPLVCLAASVYLHP